MLYAAHYHCRQSAHQISYAFGLINRVQSDMQPDLKSLDDIEARLATAQTQIDQTQRIIQTLRTHQETQP